MRGYPEPTHNKLGVLINGRDLNQPDPPFGGDCAPLAPAGQFCVLQEASPLRA